MLSGIEVFNLFVSDHLRELSFFSSQGGGGGLVETGGSSKITDQTGGSRKNNCHRRGDQTFLLHCFKKNRTGTFDAATRTILHFSTVDQGYLSYYFYLKTFKSKKDFRIQIIRQILTHFFPK